MTPPADSRKSGPQRVLDLVEKLGNKVPHPAVLFVLLIAAVVVLSHLLERMGTSVTYQRINPQTHEIESVTTTVNSLLSADGIRFIFTSVVPNFINFGPVGIILVAMIGVGLAERSGLIQALIRKIVAVAPESAITAIVITLGVLSSIASDAGYLVLIPLGAVAFHSLRPQSAGRTGRGLCRRGRRLRRQFPRQADRRHPRRNDQRRHPPRRSGEVDRPDGELLFRRRLEPAADRRLHGRFDLDRRAAARQVSRRLAAAKSARRIRERIERARRTRSSCWPVSCSSFAF